MFINYILGPNSGIVQHKSYYEENTRTVETKHHNTHTKKKKKLALKTITESASKLIYTSYIYFIDLTQAFDRVRLTDIVPLLKQRKIDPYILGLISELNTGTSTFIKTDSDMTNEIPIKKKIRGHG